MAAYRRNLKVDQGSTFRFKAVWKVKEPLPDPPTEPTPAPVFVPVDLTGCTARSQFRPSVESSEVLLELTTANGRIVLGGTTGEVEIVIDAENTAAARWPSAVYDLEIMFPNGDVRRLLSGAVVLSFEVTRNDV